MEAIRSFLDEIRRSDWDTQQRKYNNISVQESEQSYNKKIASMYSAATVALLAIPTEKYYILKGLIDEVQSVQDVFEMPSKELLNSLMHDFELSGNQIRSLKDDYDYLIFVRECMKIQMHYLELFKNKFSSRPNETETVEEQKNNPTNTTNMNEPIKGVKGLAEYPNIDKTKEQTTIETVEKQKNNPTNIKNENEPIKGVKGLAAFLNIGTTKAQEIINSKILEKNGIAYRIGNSWMFNKQKLNKLLAKHPTILYKRNK